MRLSRLERADEPIRIGQRGAEATLDELRVTRTDRGVAVASFDGRVAVDLVEHLLAAVAGLGVRTGLHLDVEGDELPLLDGGSLAFVEALRALELSTSPPRLVVRASATIEHRGSHYRFTPGPSVRLAVAVEFPAPIGREEASWDGEPSSFSADIAPARTFGFAADYEALRAAGRAAGVSLDSVLVFDERGVLPGCPPPRPREVARHKLLDLIGDLALYGGPPLGSIDATRPGHTATHAVVAEARARGILEVVR